MDRNIEVHIAPSSKDSYVKLNGVDISHFVRRVTVDQEVGMLAVVKLELLATSGLAEAAGELGLDLEKVPLQKGWVRVEDVPISRETHDAKGTEPQISDMERHLLEILTEIRKERAEIERELGRD